MTTTLLIYMSADNNLNNFAEEDLESLKKGSIGSQIDVVVQLDRWEFVDVQETIRYHIKDGEMEEIAHLGETNSGDPKVLKSFIEASARAYSSDTLIVVLWSHGTGVDDFDIYNLKRKRYFVPKEEIEEIAISFDDSAKDFLDNIELKKALDVDVSIDILGFDACLMGMFEVAYQLRESAKIMVASQHVEPASGWDYLRILKDLSLKENTLNMAEELVEFYGDYYEPESYDVTQSAYNLESIEKVAKQIDEFAKLLLENLESRKELKYTLLNAQLFNKNEYVDVVDFVKKALERLDIEALKIPANRLLCSLKQFIVANHNMGYSMRDANGVSLYFPSQKRPFKETFEMYEKLEFSQNYPNWIALIKWYYK